MLVYLESFFSGDFVESLLLYSPFPMLYLQDWRCNSSSLDKTEHVNLTRLLWKSSIPNTIINVRLFLGNISVRGCLMAVSWNIIYVMLSSCILRRSIHLFNIAREKNDKWRVGYRTLTTLWFAKFTHYTSYIIHRS